MINDENGLIGCILIDPEILYKLGSRIKPIMFTSRIASECFNSMLALYDRGKEVTYPAIVPMMTMNGIEQNDAAAFMNECISATSVSAAWKSYSNNIREEYRKRSLISIMDDVRSEFQSKVSDKLITKLQTELDGLVEEAENRPHTIEEIAESLKDYYFTEKKEIGIKTGYWELDNLLGGLEGGDITVIGARPSVGKSVFALNIMMNVAGRGKRVGLFSLEMNEKQLYERMLVKFTNAVDLYALREYKTATKEMIADMQQAREHLMKYKDNIVITSGGKTISQIKSESRHMKYDLIIIDYLQLVRADTKYNNRTAEVGFISKQLKALAMELNVPIILLAQLNRESTKRQGASKEPEMDELRESGDIEQDASNVLLMWHMDDTKKNIGLKIAKNRQGQLGRIGLVFDGSHMNLTVFRGDWGAFQNRINVNNNTRKELEEIERTPFD